MEFGLKVNPAVLTDQESRGRFGDARTLLHALRAGGAEFVEFSISEETSFAEILQLGVVAADCGIGCSLHPYLHDQWAPEVFDAEKVGPELRRLFEVAQRVAESTRNPVTMVFHGGVANGEPHRRSLDDARASGKAFMQWVGQLVENEMPDVRVFAEVQLPHDAEDNGLVRIGDTWDGCLELIEGTSVDACWDFGHSWRGVILGKHTETPPERFLRRVGHVHLHDAQQAAGVFRDHLPPGEGSGMWRRYLALLVRRGYDGRVLFELGYNSLEDAVRIVELCLMEATDVIASVEAPRVAGGKAAD